MLTLSNGKAFTAVDDDMYEYLSQWKWYITKTGRVVRNEYTGKIDGEYKYRQVHLARLIMNEPDALVDHADGDPLNNLRSNLRLANKAQNSMNQRRQITGKSQYKGVTITNSQTKPYRARITVCGKRKLLGDFVTEKEAAIAYNNAASFYFGEFACLNQVDAHEPVSV